MSGHQNIECKTVIGSNNLCLIIIPDGIFTSLAKNTDDGCLHCSRYYSYDLECEIKSDKRLFFIITIKSSHSSFKISFRFIHEMLKSMAKSGFVLISESDQIPKNENDHCHLLAVPLDEKMINKINSFLVRQIKERYG